MSERTAILQERHILLRQNAGNDTLCCHDGLPSYRRQRSYASAPDINADDHVDTGRQLVAVLAGKYLNVYNDTGFAMRRSREVSRTIAGLLAEDRARSRRSLCGQLGLALQG